MSLMVSDKNNKFIRISSLIIHPGIFSRHNFAFLAHIDIFIIFYEKKDLEKIEFPILIQFIYLFEHLGIDIIFV